MPPWIAPTHYGINATAKPQNVLGEHKCFFLGTRPSAASTKALVSPNDLGPSSITSHAMQLLIQGQATINPITLRPKVTRSHRLDLMTLPA